LNQKPLLILDLSIQKNQDVEELDGVTLIHGLFISVNR
jgi:hypothetical protein